MRPLTWLAPPRARGRSPAPCSSTAIVVAVAPRVCGDRQRPRRAAGRAAARSSRWPSARTSTTRTATRSPCSSARTASRSRSPTGPPAGDRRLPRRRGQGVLPRTTASTSAASSGPRCRTSPSDAPQQGASTITMQVVKNEFLAGLERDGRYKLLQVHYALMLEKRVHQGPDPRALPQHRLLRQQRLRHPGRGRDVLRQDRRPADVHRGGVPRRPRAVAVRLRPDQQPRAQPGPVRPGARPPRRRRRRSPRPRRADAAPTFVLPERGCRPPADQPATRARTTPRRCATTCSTAVDHPRHDVRGALRRRSTAAACGSTPRSIPILQAHGRAGPQRAARHAAGLRRGDRLARHADRGDPGDGRRPRLRAGRAARSTWRSSPRQTGSSIKLFILAAALQAGAQPDDVIDGQRPCMLPNPGDPSEPFVITRRRQPRRPTRCGTMTWCSINCAYARLAQIVGLNRVVDTTYRMAQSPYLYPGQPESERDPIAAVRQLRDRRQRDVAARHGVGRADDRQRGPAPRAVLRRVRSTTGDGRRIYTHDDPGTQVLDPGVAADRGRRPEGRAAPSGTGRRYPLERSPGGGQDRAPRRTTPTPGSSASRRS